jgi:hypothetical protein
VRPRLALALPLALGAWLWVSPAMAEDAVQAARHFDLGTMHYKAGRFRDAEAEFQQAWEQKHTFDIAANLGDCEVEIGQYRDAAEHLAYALKELPITVKEGVRQRLQTRFGLARAEVAAVRVKVTPPQATVIVNGHEFSPAPDEVFLEPGPATVEARIPGYESARAATGAIAKGASQDVVITLKPLPTQQVEVEPKKSLPLILTGAGLTAAGLVAGLAFTLVGSAKGSDADATLKRIVADHAGDPSPCSAVPPDARCGQLKSLNGDADTMSNAGTVAFIATGVVAAATLTYILIPTKSREPAAGRSSVGPTRADLRVAPVIAPGFGGAFLSASF